MSTIAKGLNVVDTKMYDWSEEDRDEAIQFALHPGNSPTTVHLYLNSKGIKCSIGTTHKWQQSLRNKSERIERMRHIFDDFKGITSDEINCYMAVSLAEIMVSLHKDIEEKGLDLRKIQSLTSLAKEARSSALAMNSIHSSASTKELELGYCLSFAEKLEAIFEFDDVVSERVKNACKALLIEIEGQYTQSN